MSKVAIGRRVSGYIALPAKDSKSRMIKQYEDAYPKVCCNLEYNQQKTQKSLTAMKRARKNADNDCQRGNMCKRHHSVNITPKSEHLFPFLMNMHFFVF